MRARQAILLLAMLALPAAAADRSGWAGHTLDGGAVSLDGGAVSLDAWRGHVVLVNYWATWCAPCRAEMPALDAAYRRRHGDGLEMLAIAMDAGGPTKKIRAATAGFAFPVARIDDVRMARSAMPSALPETRVYDRAGRLRATVAAGTGPPLDQAAIERIVAPLLTEHAPRAPD